jgi:adenylate cyclase
VRVAQGSASFILSADPVRLVAGEIDVPVDENTEIRLHLSRPETWPERTISASAVLAGALPNGISFEEKIVVIGSSAPEAGAFLPLAGSALAPTVQLQADTIDQILAGRFLTRPQAAEHFELAAMLAIGALAVALALWLSPGFAALAALGLTTAWVAFAAFMFLRSGLLIDPLGPSLAALVAAAATELAGFIRTRALKTAILQKFERYVPPEVVARLVREPEMLRLDGELCEVTAMVTDVEDFSRMTENSDPRALLRVLDAYFDRVTELIVKHGGMVDKIVGDAVLAFFNIPARLPDHPAAAVRCAREILAATEAFRNEGEAATLGFGRTRFGIESGMAIVGDVGGRRRLDYTAYGVVVNKAVRFQDANKALKSSICIGPVAAEQVQETIALRPLGRIAVRGMQGLCDVFEPWTDGRAPLLPGGEGAREAGG